MRETATCLVGGCHALPMKTAILSFKFPPALQPWITALVSAAALAIPLWLLHRSNAGLAPVVFLLTGQAFADRAIVTGGALDQFSLHKEVFIFCYSLVHLCPFIAFVRWINDQSSRAVRSVATVLSLVLLVHPLSVLTIFTYDVARYVVFMGVTSKRLLGLALAVFAYLAILRFAVWIYGPNKSHKTTKAIYSVRQASRLSLIFRSPIRPLKPTP
jgi:hypothetical protein